MTFNIPQNWNGKDHLEDYREGIYFNMPEEEYHAIPYFSNSGADNLFQHPLIYWWNSPLNQDLKPSETTPALEFGKAFHSLILEPEKFSQIYVTTPRVEDYGDYRIIEGNNGLKEFLESKSLKKSGNKADLIERAEPYIDPKKEILWDVVLQNFKRKVSEEGLRVISHDQIESLYFMERMVKMNPDAKYATTGGHSEVVIIWRNPQTQVLCKCRVDYLKTEGIVDLKTFSNSQRKNLYTAMGDTITYNRYNRQYVMYNEALKEVLKNKDKVVSCAPKGDFMEKLSSHNDHRFFLVFVLSQAPHPCIIRELWEYPCEGGGTKNVYYDIAKNDLYDITVKKYSDCLEKFGTSPWLGDKDSAVLTDEEVPHILYQGYRT